MKRKADELDEAPASQKAREGTVTLGLSSLKATNEAQIQSTKMTGQTTPIHPLRKRTKKPLVRHSHLARRQRPAQPPGHHARRTSTAATRTAASPSPVPLVSRSTSYHTRGAVPSPASNAPRPSSATTTSNATSRPRIPRSATTSATGQVVGRASRAAPASDAM